MKWRLPGPQLPAQAVRRPVSERFGAPPRRRRPLHAAYGPNRSGCDRWRERSGSTCRRRCRSTSSRRLLAAFRPVDQLLVCSQRNLTCCLARKGRLVLASALRLSTQTRVENPALRIPRMGEYAVLFGGCRRWSPFHFAGARARSSMPNGRGHPAERTTPGGTSSIWMRTGMRWARRTHVKIGLTVATP